MRRIGTKLALMLAVVGTMLAPALASVPTAQAAGGIVFDGSPGIAAPPSTLGPYTMTPFSADPTPNGTAVTSVASPLGGNVTFDRPLNKVTIGSGWATWSHGYTGDVYTNVDDSFDLTTLTIGLPANTLAFYTYIEPDAFNTFSITATAQDGTTSGPVDVNGSSGATYFGFYGDASNPIVSIAITADAGAGGFAVGEFGIGGFSSDITLNKIVAGDAQAAGPVTVEVTCTSGDPQTVTFPAEGGSQVVTVGSSLDTPNACTFTETDKAGATTTSYVCTGSVPQEQPPEIPSAAQTAEEVCPSAGPQDTPITVNVLDPAQTADVTITNTFALRIQPNFPG
jgi:hypothetical protein